MVIVHFFPYFILVGSHASLAWAELLVLGALVGQILWKRCNILGLATSC